MRNDAEELGSIIRKRRELLGLLQPDLADVAGISTRTIQLVEQGKGNPSLETLYKLIHPLGLTFKVELKSASENNKS